MLKRYQVSEAAYRDYAETTIWRFQTRCGRCWPRSWAAHLAGMTLSQIKDTILTYLDSNMTYQPGRQTENGDTDFILYTLQESPYGYSVHYATIATMMLRYYGIPARYCEGYYVSGDEAATYAAGQTVTFTEAKSHAWTEYYLAGVGWLPFEVTPGYVDKEELEGEGLGGGGRTYMAPGSTSPRRPRRRTQRMKTAPCRSSASGGCWRRWAACCWCSQRCWRRAGCACAAVWRRSPRRRIKQPLLCALPTPPG